jgi:gamma-glutamylcyclotransferase (GGCT)/AIG2-like uncharacterized protein YtfP
VTRLFVYGTLTDKQQFAWASGLSRDTTQVRRLGERTLRGFKRKPFGKIAYFPTIVPDEESEVTGVVYQVDDRQIAYLDVYEGFPSLYRRVSVELDDGPAVAYVQNERWNG